MIVFHDGLVREPRPGHRLDLSFSISGASAPVATFRLAPGQGVLCDPSSVLLQDEAVELRSWPGVSGRLRLAVNSGPEPARLMLASGSPGHLIGFELSAFGGRLLATGDALVAAGPGVAVGLYARLARPEGDRALALYRLEGAGWAFLRARGDAIEETVRGGAPTRIRAATLLAATAGIDMDPAPSGSRDLDLKGPGRVWLQTGAQLPGLEDVATTASRELQAVPAPFSFEARIQS